MTTIERMLLLMHHCYYGAGAGCCDDDNVESLIVLFLIRTTEMGVEVKIWREGVSYGLERGC